MARRERTTGLPRPRRRERAVSGRRFAGITWDERHVRLGIIGVSAALLFLVLALFGNRCYEDKIGRPNSVVLTVGDQKVKLSYYADRLVQFLQAQQGTGTSVATAEQALLTKLEEEALTIEVAKDRGITITDDDVTQAIAEDLGVPAGGSGSAFDSLYRQRLKTLKISDSNYRRLTRASVANKRLLDSFSQEVGSTGELVTLRAIVVNDRATADAIVQRLQGGEDFGTIAQTESSDLDSRQRDGLMQPQPAQLLPDSVRTAIEGKSAGQDLIGPVEVQNNFWVFRIDKRDPGGQYTDQQTTQLAQIKLDAAITAKRTSLKITRNLSDSDITWAEKEAGLRQ
jgi:peptidyl-prolyl cis-trans isomerase C/foldase protein PrsA